MASLGWTKSLSPSSLMWRWRCLLTTHWETVGHQDSCQPWILLVCTCVPPAGKGWTGGKPHLLSDFTFLTRSGISLTHNVRNCNKYAECWGGLNLNPSRHLAFRVKPLVKRIKNYCAYCRTGFHWEYKWLTWPHHLFNDIRVQNKICLAYLSVFNNSCIKTKICVAYSFIW